LPPQGHWLRGCRGRPQGHGRAGDYRRHKVIGFVDAATQFLDGCDLGA